MPSAAAVSQRRGEAGRAGKDVRSDLHVTFEERDSGVVEIELRSRVDLYYGEAIRAQAVNTLTQLGVTEARLSILDEGALPFVIDARIEAAVRRAGINTVVVPSSQAVSLAPPAARDRLRRSRLYLPGNEPKYFINAALHAPDAVILDLEDSVHVDEKDAARVLVRNALQAVDFRHCERMVRINQLPLGLADLEEIVAQGPDLVLIPKTETAEQVREVDAAITAIQNQAGITRPAWLVPIVESALGVENAFEIARASDRNVAITIGLEDYTADLGVAKTRDGNESLYARMRLVNAAHAAGLQAIDSVYGDVADEEGLLRWALASCALGFEGMGCVHPQQIPIVHRAFAPSLAEINKAQAIARAFEEAKSWGMGVVSLGSKMIDPPVVQRALKLLERARQMGLAPETDSTGEAQ